MIIDDRYAPVLISIWRGRSELENVKWHWAEHNAIIEEFVRRGQRFVLVSDASEAERPSPTVRKFFADSSDASPKEWADFTLANYVVFTSAVMRGTLTAISWVSERAARIKTAASVQEAIERALADLDAAGIPRPAGLDPANYRPPPAEHLASQ